jgi:hypothetical protein
MLHTHGTFSLVAGSRSRWSLVVVLTQIMFYSTHRQDDTVLRIGNAGSSP